MSGCFSQKFTIINKDTLVTISKSDFVASIAKMNEGRYYKQQYTDSENIIRLMQKSIYLRDAKITLLDSLNLNYDKQLKDVVIKYNYDIGNLQKQNSSIKKQGKVKSYIIIGMGLTLSAFLIAK